jgi:LysM repeat protein
MTIRRIAQSTRLVGRLTFIVAVFCVVLGTSASAVEQGGLGGKPAHPKADNSRSQSIFVHALDPGKQARDGVEVINNTTKTKQVLVYAVDSQVSSGGAFACAQMADKPIAVGTWVTLDKTQITLEPRSKQVVDFTIKTPKNASPGEHNGCIVIQDTEQHTTSDSNGIVLSLRSAIRLSVTIPGDIKKGLVFTGVGAQTKEDKKLLLSTGLRNNGNVSLDTKIEVKLSYPIGLTSANVGGSFPVLSGNEGRFNFEAERPFWGGWYRLTATAQYNNKVDTVIGEGNPNASISDGTWIFVSPQPIAAAIEGAALVVVATTATFLVRRRLTHKRATQSGHKYVVEPNENLHTIAEEAGVSWKLVARINRLKPPYQLKAGQTLIVPSKHANLHKKQTPRHRTR